MKLTTEVKNQIDKMSPHQIFTMFRFHPTNLTTGESGKYMQIAVRNRIINNKKEFSREQKPKVFGIT